MSSCVSTLQRACHFTPKSKMSSQTVFPAVRCLWEAQLPSEEELIREFDVSRTTIRTTIENLVRQGLVDIRRGRGTFVASPRMIQELTEFIGFVEDMRLLGRTPTARVVSRGVVPADRINLRSLRGRQWCKSGVSGFQTASRFPSTRRICRRTRLRRRQPGPSAPRVAGICKLPGDRLSTHLCSARG